VLAEDNRFFRKNKDQRGNLLQNQKDWPRAADLMNNLVDSVVFWTTSSAVATKRAVDDREFCI
jgi:hypothetical protein